MDAPVSWAEEVEVPRPLRFRPRRNCVALAFPAARDRHPTIRCPRATWPAVAAARRPWMNWWSTPASTVSVEQISLHETEIGLEET
jgi:hypothetical protein